MIQNWTNLNEMAKDNEWHQKNWNSWKRFTLKTQMWVEIPEKYRSKNILKSNAPVQAKNYPQFE